MKTQISYNIFNKISLVKKPLVRLILATMIVQQFAVFSYKTAPTALAACANVTPSIALNVPAAGLVGDTVSFTATFQNTGSAAGYGPYIEVVLPAGADGNDGFNFASANFLGAGLMPTNIITLSSTGTAANPLTAGANGLPLVMNYGVGSAGAKVLIFQLPFGSFVPGQTPAVITINTTMSNLADAGFPLNVQANSGFALGCDALNNPSTDASSVGTPTTGSTLPAVFTIRKVYNGPESETSTGPNYPRSYTISADIANGQTLSNFKLQDFLPNSMQFVSITGITPAGGVISTGAGLATNPQNVPNNLAEVTWASVTGGAGASDASFTLNFYIPQNDANGSPVISPVTGDARPSVNDAKARGNWTPIDPRDAAQGGVLTSDVTLNDHTLTDRSLAIQKSVANITGPGRTTKPGDVLEYTINTQVSDYFTFDDLIITDTFSDGQRIDATFVPTITVAERGVNNSGAFTLNTNYFIDLTQIGNNTNPATDGSTKLTFNVSTTTLAIGGVDRILQGGSAILPAAGPTTVTIKFRVIVQDTFSDTYLPGDKSVSIGDTLSNSITADGRILNNTTLAPTGSRESDTSATVIGVTSNQLAKTIYAVNGSTSFASPVIVAPGDTITYRLEYDLPSTDFENLNFQDYLPLPTFTAGQVTAFNPVVGTPIAGQASWGPTDTYHNVVGIGTTPIITSNAASNALNFNFGTYEDPLNTISKIDVLFTVTISNEPMADGLQLTNQATVKHDNTFGSPQGSTAIVQVKLNQPKLNIKKGIVAKDQGVIAPLPAAPVTFSLPGGACPRNGAIVNSDNLLTTPIDSNLTGVDAGDKITYALTIENTGNSASGAFDVRFKDLLPAGLTVPVGTTAAINLCVTDGAGVPLLYTAVGGGVATSGSLFGAGLELVDLATTGALGSFSSTTGKNIVLVTYDLPVATTQLATTNYVNEASIFNFSSKNLGTNFLTDAVKDTANFTTLAPSISKVLASTSAASSTGNSVMIGEKITYVVTVVVPEGNLGTTTLVDTLDAGLAFVGINSITTSSGVVASAGTYAAIAGAASFTGSGQTMTLNFGNISNTNSSNNATETITISYDAVVLNVAANTRGLALNNSVNFNYGTSTPITTVGAPNAIVASPNVVTSKTISPISGDAGDVATYTIAVSNLAPADAAAYDVNVSDIVPADMLVQAGTWALVSGVPAGSVTLTQTGNNLNAVISTLPIGSTATFQFVVRVQGAVIPGTTIKNIATTTFTTMPGAIGTQSTFNTNSIEGNGTSTAQADYVTLGSVPVKTIVNTSEAGTVGNGSLAIGEIVRYRITAGLPEGLNPNFTIIDNIPAGMKFLDDGQVKAAIVLSNVASTTGSLAPAMNLKVLGTGTFVPTTTIPASLVSGTPFVDGTDVTFNFGNILNQEFDADREYVVIEFNAVVLNVIGNQAYNNVNGAVSGPTTLQNSIDIRINNALTDSTSSPASIVVEPSINNLSKTLTVTPLNAGDATQYTITFTNTGSASAFNINVLDTLDQYLSFATGSVLVSNPGYGSSNVTVAGQNLSVNITELKAGDSMTIIVNATTIQSIPNGYILPNTATIGYASLLGAGTGAATTSTTTNPTGSSANEGRGNTGGVNDYGSAAGATTTLDTPTIDKVLVGATTSYAVGSIVMWDIIVNLKEGVTRALNIFDIMPAGLKYTSSQIITASTTLGVNYNGTLGTPIVSTSTVGGTTTLQLNFGNATTTADNVASTDSFIVRVFTIVANIVSNVQNVVLSNNATLTYTNPNTGATATTTDATPPSITIAEPKLIMTKSFSPASTTASGTVILTLSVTNIGAATAYDVVFSDPIYSAYLTSVTPSSTPANFIATSAVAGATTTVTYTGGSILSGQNIVATMVLKVSATATPTTTLNIATINDYSSVLGTSTDDKHYASTTATATLEIIAPDISVTKTDGRATTSAGTSNVYSINVVNSGKATATNVIVTETVPAGTTFMVTGSSAGWNCTSVNAGGVCTVNLATVNGLSTTILTFAAQVISPITYPLTQIVNTVSAYDDGTNGTDTTPNNVATDTDTLTDKPDILITKTGVGLFKAGGVGTFKFTIANVGTMYSTGTLTMSDTLPAGMTFASATAPAPWSCATSAGANVSCTFAATNYPAGSSTDIFVDVNISTSTLGNVINTVTVTTPNGDATSTNNTSSTTVTVLTPKLNISKKITPNNAAVGDQVTIRLDVGNIGNMTAYNAVIEDPVNNVKFGSFTNIVAPSGFAYSAPVAGATTTVTYTGGDIPAGSTSTYLFSAVLTTANNFNDVYINTAKIATYKNGTTTDALTFGGETASDTVKVLAPNLKITKDDGVINLVAGSSTVYNITVTNIGNATSTGVIIKEIIPSGITIDFANSNPNWGCTAATCTLAVGSLAPSSTMSYAFALTVNNPVVYPLTNIINKVIVSDDGLHGTDTDMTDNAATDTDAISTQADLSINKTAVGEFFVGHTAQFRFDVANIARTYALTPITVTDNLPIGLTFVSATGTGWSCANASQLVTCTYGTGTNVPASSTMPSILMNVNVGTSSYGTTTNSASAVSSSTDASTTNNTASTTFVVYQPKLKISKTFATSAAAVNDIVPVTLTVENYGNATATAVSIWDDLFDNWFGFVGGVTTPAGFTLSTSSAAPTTTVKYDGGLVAPSSTISFVFNSIIKTTAQFGSILTNLVTIKNYTDGTATGTQVYGGEKATATIEVIAPDLLITKTDNSATTYSGSSTVYALTVTNLGRATATGVIITETVPAGSTFSLATSTAGWSCADGAASGTVCNMNAGTLAAGASTIVYFGLVVDIPVPYPIESIVNVAFVKDDGLHGTDTNMLNNTATDTDIISTKPNLVMSKASVGQFTANGKGIFKLGVKNEGIIAATNTITVTDNLPAGLTFDSYAISPSASSSVWTCTGGGTTISCTTDEDLLVGQSLPDILVKVNILLAATSTATNTASVTTNGPEDTITDNTATVAVDIVAPKLKLSKKFSTSTAAVNDTVWVTLDVENIGSADAYDVAVEDGVDMTKFSQIIASSTPLGFMFSTSSAGSTTTVKYQGGTIAKGAIFTFIFNLIVSPNARFNDSIVNVANIAQYFSGPASDADRVTYGGETATDTLRIIAPDLAITKTNATNSVTVGSSSAYTITVVNKGEKEASNVMVLETVANNSVFNAGLSTTGWTCNPAPGTASSSCVMMVPTIAPNATVTLTFAVDIVGPVMYPNTSLTNTVLVLDDGSHGNEPTTTDNVATDTDNIIAYLDFAISKTHIGNIVVDQNATYTIAIKNIGNMYATGTVYATDTLPVGQTFVSANGSGWTCAESAGIVSCSYAIPIAIEAGSSTPNLNIVTHVTPAAMPTSVNVASVGCNCTDASTTNNVATDTAPVKNDIDLELNKVLTTNTPFAVGQTISFLISIVNKGLTTATNIQVTDAVPAGLTFVASNPSVGIYNPATGIWTVPSLANNATATLSVSIALSSAGNFVNVAQVSAATQPDIDSTPSDNMGDEYASVGFYSPAASIILPPCCGGGGPSPTGTTTNPTSTTTNPVNPTSTTTPIGTSTNPTNPNNPKNPINPSNINPTQAIKNLLGIKSKKVNVMAATDSTAYTNMIISIGIISIMFAMMCTQKSMYMRNRKSYKIVKR